MLLNKRDFFTIAVLSIIFLGMATWNLGYTQTPVTSDTFQSGHSFYVDLGSVQNVGSLYFLIKDGTYNVTVYYGSPGDWHLAVLGSSFSGYCVWNQDINVYDNKMRSYCTINQATQYLKVDFNASTSNAIIEEMAVTDFDNQQLTIADVVAINYDTASLHNLIDEQSYVHLPATYLTQTYFDEPYFVRTADQYLHLQWPYEWTHPPLGKLIQAAGIAILGFNPFGWRFIGVIFAAAMIPVMYALGKKLFGTWIGGFTAAFLLTFDFMHFVMGRMGTTDTYLVFFSIVSELFFVIYFMDVLKKGWKAPVLPLFLAVVFFALSFATKWVALYGAVGMLALLVALRLREVHNIKDRLAAKYAHFFDHPFLLLMGFIGVAVLIYFLTYIPDMIIGRPLLGTYGNGIIDLQFAMYHYHATLDVSPVNQYGSAWWSWPFMLTPRWFAITYLPNKVDSTISAFGNPAVWWVGFAAVIVVAERAIRGQELVIALKNRLSKKKPAPEPTAPALDTTDATAPTAVAEQPLQQPPEQTPPEITEPKPLEEPVTPEAVDAPKPQGRRWDFAAIFIAAVFFFSWLPYVFITRLTYIYHFYLSVPLLCLASAYLVNEYWHTKAGKIVSIAFFASVVILFIVFYPVISGMPAPTSYIYDLKWLKGWFFAP
jgi:hypothetical protein